jgi:hypothetical protein
MIGQNQAQNARAEAQHNEMQRQKGYRDKAQAVADQSIAESGRDTADPAIAKGADERAAAYNRIINQVQSPATVTQNRVVSTGTPTATSTAQSASAQAWNRILGGAQARLGGYGDWGLSRNIAAHRAGQKLDAIGTDARHSAEILAADMQDAGHAGDGWSTAGSLASTIGALGGMYGAVGGAGAGAGAGVSGWGEITPAGYTDPSELIQFANSIR